MSNMRLFKSLYDSTIVDRRIPDVVVVSDSVTIYAYRRCNQPDQAYVSPSWYKGVDTLIQVGSSVHAALIQIQDP